MGFFDNWPYTDFHRLNLDWILGKVQDLETAFSGLAQRLARVEEKARDNAYDIDKLGAKVENITPDSIGAIPLTGSSNITGTLETAGDVKGHYIQGEWLKTSANTRATFNLQKFVVQDNAGWLFYCTREDLVSTIVKVEDISDTVTGVAGYTRKKIYRIGPMVFVNVSINLPSTFDGNLLENLPSALVTSAILQPVPGGNASVYIVGDTNFIQAHGLPAGPLSINNFYISKE